MDNIREYLKLQTRSEHEKTESLISKDVFNNPTKMYAYIESQAYAFYFLEKYLNTFGFEYFSEGQLESDGYRRMKNFITDEDDAAIRNWQPRFKISCSPTMSYLQGVKYVVEGSKLGSRIIHNMLVGSDNDHLKKLSAAFFTTTDSWESFIKHLQTQTIDKNECVEGASAAFKIFQESMTESSYLS